MSENKIELKEYGDIEISILSSKLMLTVDDCGSFAEVYLHADEAVQLRDHLTELIDKIKGEAK